MSGFIQGEDRTQATLFPERLDDYVAEDSPVRVIDVFIDELDLAGLGFRTEPNDTGRPAYHPATMLKLFVYGYGGGGRPSGAQWLFKPTPAGDYARLASLVNKAEPGDMPDFDPALKMALAGFRKVPDAAILEAGSRSRSTRIRRMARAAMAKKWARLRHTTRV